MSKTPEEMAEEYAESILIYDYNTIEIGGRALLRKGFLAGYKAGHGQALEIKGRMDNAIDRMLQRATGKPPESQWISVKERLPDRDQEVLGYEKPFISTCLFWRSRSFLMEHQWELSNGRNCNPTHWMPLPRPPEDK